MCGPSDNLRPTGCAPLPALIPKTPRLPVTSALRDFRWTRQQHNDEDKYNHKGKDKDKGNYKSKDLWRGTLSKNQIPRPTESILCSTPLGKSSSRISLWSSTSWLPYSTYLYLDFHLLCSMTKLKGHSREICWSSTKLSKSKHRPPSTSLLIPSTQ